MPTPFIKRVFPERNRTALEGSPERTAVEGNQRVIDTTFGHVATKVLELLSDHPDQTRVLELVLQTFPKEMHSASLTQDHHSILNYTISFMLQDLFSKPIRVASGTLTKLLQEEIQPLIAETEAKKDKCIPVSRFCEWLKDTKFTSLGELTSDDRTAILMQFDHWTDQGWIQTLEETGELSEEQLTEPLLPSEIQKLANAITDWKMEPASYASSDISRRLLHRIRGLFIVTEEIRSDLEAKYPLQNGQ